MQNTTRSPPFSCSHSFPLGHACQWPEMLYQSAREAGDLNNHRGICLISLWGRVLGRIVAARLARYAEQQGILDTAQWGALAVARRVLDAASKPFGSQVLDPCCVEPLDLKKAYPNSSRNAFSQCCATLELRRDFCGTQYRCRVGKILSEPFTMQRGFKEGCQLPRWSSISCKRAFCQRGDKRWLEQGPPESINGHLWNSTRSRQRCDPIPGPTMAGATCGRDFSMARDRAGLLCFADDTNMSHKGKCGSTPQNVTVKTHGTMERHSSSGQVAAPGLQAFTYSGRTGQVQGSGNGPAGS